MTNLETYINKLTGERKSFHTIIAYKTDIEQFLNFINKTERDIEYLDALSWKNSISNFAPATINRKIIILNQYFNFLKKASIITNNPFEEIENVKNIPVRTKQYIPMEDAKALLLNAKNNRDAAIVAVYLTTGMRVNELINLTIEDYESKAVSIITKGQVKRHIIFNADCCKYIDAYLKERKNSEFNNLFISNSKKPMRPECIERTLKIIAKRSGISSDITNHSLRHTHISYMTDKYGISAAQHEIGHSNPNITARYSHNTTAQIENMINSVSI